ncbi:MAG: pantoate--beta-alanine ligase [Planctomycetota bacterium]
MLHVSDHATLTSTADAWRAAGQRVGFVPTLGALHAGHLSLVQAAQAACDRVVVSVFLNPTQFAPTEDLARYPADLERDRRLLLEAGVDALFTTTPEAMYPPGYATWVEVEGLTDRLCGASRPGHFRGVTTVVTKLLNLVGPCAAFFGEKDRQQLIVLRRLIADLNLPVEAVGCPIVREPDGLALSSRNAYLSPDERERALALSRGLRAAAAAFAQGERSGPALEERVRAALRARGADVDYVELVDPVSLARLEVAQVGAVLAVAARVGTTRLIDNHALGALES